MDTQVGKQNESASWKLSQHRAHAHYYMCYNPPKVQSPKHESLDILFGLFSEIHINGIIQHGSLPLGFCT